MAPRRRSSRALLRTFDALFERAGAKPLGVLVFVASVIGLLTLEVGSSQHIRARALGHAPATEHTAYTRSVIEEVHVQPGDDVQPGAPLVTLSSRFIERDLALLDAEIARLEKETLLEQARLLTGEQALRDTLTEKVAQAQRDRSVAQAQERQSTGLVDIARQRLEAAQQRAEAKLARADEALQAQLAFDTAQTGARRARDLARAELALLQALEGLLSQRPEEPALSQATLELKQAELQVLRTRRDTLLTDRNALTLRANQSGRVARVAPLGSAVDVGTPLVTLYPPSARELVVYLPADTPPHTVSPGDAVHFSNAQRGCDSPGRVLRIGAGVEQAPSQLVNFMRFPVHGTPIYASIPEDCMLAVGQLVDVELVR